MNIIESLNWRYATKKFDINKKVSKDDLDDIIEAFRLTPSSFGLEPWKLIVVEKQDIKDSLFEASFNQEQITTCSHLLVLCRVENISGEHLDKVFNNMAETNQVKRDSLAWYEEVVNWFLSRMDVREKNTWADYQVYIALWILHTVLAVKEIDSCSIGWFNSMKYDEILWLKEKWLSSVVVLPIGYRDESDKYAARKKARLNREEISEII